MDYGKLLLLVVIACGSIYKIITNEHKDIYVYASLFAGYFLLETLSGITGWNYISFVFLAGAVAFGLYRFTGWYVKQKHNNE